MVDVRAVNSEDEALCDRITIYLQPVSTDIWSVIQKFLHVDNFVNKYCKKLLCPHSLAISLLDFFRPCPIKFLVYIFSVYIVVWTMLFLSVIK